MSNIIDSIQLSGTVYTIQGSGGGNPTVELTQAEYNALVESGAVQSNTYYIITDATAFDPSTKVDTSAFTAYSAATNTALNNKVNTSAITSSVTSASTDSEIPTAKAVWEAASGGGKAIEGGRGITVTTGATADTVSFNLPISAGTGSNSIAEGENTQAVGYNSHAEGNSTRAGGQYSHAEGLSTSANTISSHAEGYKTLAKGAKSHVEGDNTIANNESEHASGRYNVSTSGSSTFGNSGNTLFSVGNGTANNARHNAFEIRQNGDIYLSSGGTDIKLQDHLGGTASSAITSGDTNAVAGGAVYDKIDEMEQVIARALNDLNDRITAIENQLNNS